MWTSSGSASVSDSPRCWGVGVKDPSLPSAFLSLANRARSGKHHDKMRPPKTYARPDRSEAITSIASVER